MIRTSAFISSAFQSSYERVEIREEINLFDEFKEKLAILHLPVKGVSAVMGWGELLPFGVGLAKSISDSRVTVKAISSTFAIPKFFTKQIKLYHAYSDLKKDLMRRCSIDQTLFDIKKIFHASLSAAVSIVKIPLLLEKTHLIDLTVASKELPGVLEKGGSLLALGASFLHLVDESWALGSYLYQNEQVLLQDPRGVLCTSKAAKLGVKFVFCIIKTSAAFISAIVIFTGWSLSPLLLVGASTLSFTASLTSKAMRHVTPLGKPMRSLQHQNFSDLL